LDTEDRLWTLHADELRQTWQARAIEATRYEPLGMVVLSVLAHSFDLAMPALLHLIFPGFQSITPPFICSHGKINKYGRIVADVVWDDWEEPTTNVVIFRNTRHLEQSFRRLADRMKLSDDDRRQLFIAARKWVTADQRLDPTMNPSDPDARRLTLH